MQSLTYCVHSVALLAGLVVIQLIGLVLVRSFVVAQFIRLFSARYAQNAQQIERLQSGGFLMSAGGPLCPPE